MHSTADQTDSFDVGVPLIVPVIEEQVFADPEAARAVIVQNGPYPWVGQMTGGHAGRSAVPLTTWFRQTWQADTAGINGRALILDNPLFVDGSRRAFPGFQVVRPESTRINLMTPMPAQKPHFDNPFFRGLNHGNTPYYLLVVMGRSGLFERWQVHVSSALIWLFDGQGGGFTYWPDGPDAPPHRIAPPMNNRTLISDNQRMYHRVEGIGGDDISPPFYDPATRLHADSGGWRMIGDGTDAYLGRNQVRISILWKALMFRNRQAERVHDDHLDDLDVTTALGILDRAARARGITLPQPGDLYADASYRTALEQAFPTRETFCGLSQGELAAAAAYGA